MAFKFLLEDEGTACCKPKASGSVVLYRGGLIHDDRFYISPHSETLRSSTLCTTYSDAKLTNDLHSKLWSIIRASGDILDLTKRKHAVNDSAEDDMFSIQKVTLRGCDEELRKGQEATKAERRNCEPDIHLCLGQNSPWTTSLVQNAFPGSSRPGSE